MSKIKRVSIIKKPLSTKVVLTFRTQLEYYNFLTAMRTTTHALLQDLAAKIDDEDELVEDLPQKF